MLNLKHTKLVDGSCSNCRAVFEIVRKPRTGFYSLFNMILNEKPALREFNINFNGATISTLITSQSASEVDDLVGDIQKRLDQHFVLKKAIDQEIKNETFNNLCEFKRINQL